MRRRQFIVGSGTAATAALAGCLGGGEDHRTAFRDDVQSRGVTLDALVVESGVVSVEYDSDSVGDDLGAVAVAFADRVGEGWDVEKLDSIAYADRTLTWYADAAWASAYIAGDIDASEYGRRINETLAPAVVVDDD